MNQLITEFRRTGVTDSGNKLRHLLNGYRPPEKISQNLHVFFHWIGMATRKKRSSSRKPLKKQRSKATKRQFLAPLPSQALQPPSLSPFALPAAPFMGVGLPVLPSPPLPQPRIPFQQTRPMAFKSRASSSLVSRVPAQSRLPVMRMSSFSSEPFQGLMPLGAFPPMPTSPFLRVPQSLNTNFFSGTTAGPWTPVDEGRQVSPVGAFNDNIGGVLYLDLYLFIYLLYIHLFNLFGVQLNEALNNLQVTDAFPQRPLSNA